MKKLIVSILLLSLLLNLNAQIDTEFWFAAPEVTELHSDRPIYLKISTLDQAATINVSQPANLSFPAQVINLDAHNSQTIELTGYIDMLENKPYDQILNYGLLITSTSLITAYYEVTGYTNPELFSLKGRNALGKSFLIPAQDYLLTQYDVGGRSGFIIAATEDDTRISITPSNDIVGHLAGITYEIILDRGETYSAIAIDPNPEAHLNGSEVISDKPIVITIYDDSMMGTVFNGCADLGGDQIVPINRIGKQYIAVRGFLNPPYDKVFILGIENDTKIFTDGNFFTTIARGETVMYNMGSAGAAFIESSSPVYVLHMSGLDCEIGLSLLPQVQCSGSNEVSFVRSNDWTLYLTLLVKQGGENSFLLNGASGIINASSFNAVPGTDGQWMYAQLFMDAVLIPPGTSASVSNSLEEFHLGLIYGQTSIGCSYGYFSDYEYTDIEINANNTEFCQGENLILSANPIPGITYEWKGPNGFTAYGPLAERSSLSEADQGFYVLNGLDYNCLVVPDSIYITVHPSPADIGEPVNPISVPDGLTAYYPFNGNANDESGSGHNGMVTNAVLGTDRCGNPSSAYVFNGLDTYIEAPGFSADLPPVTVSAWAYYDSTITTYLTPQIMGVYFPQVHLMQLEIGRPSYHIFFNAMPEIGHQTENQVFTPMDWHLVTGTYDGATSCIYYDGNKVYESQCSGSYNFLDKSIYIGRQSYDDTCYWNGKIDEVRIYNRALSAEEIMALYLEDCNRELLSVALTELYICQGESSAIKVIHSQPGISYQILQEGTTYGTPQTGNLDTLTFSVNGLLQTSSFEIRATDTAGGCSIILDTTLIVNVISMNITATAIPDDEYAPAIVSLGSASSGASAFEWFLDGNSIATTEQAEIELDAPGNYSFVLVASSGPPANCTVADTVVVVLKETINVVMNIPNAFTPNGDGINDFFEIYTEGINRSDVWIKDKWGLLIKEFDGQNDKWDGTTGSGREAPDGHYYFHVEASDYRDRPMEESGIVYLFRDLIDLTPNPASQKIMIRMNGRLPGERVASISSIDGISLFETNFSGETLEADVSMLKPGLYFLRISNGIDRQYLKFIKE
jgi:gliding motility-associated-like protein